MAYRFGTFSVDPLTRRLLRDRDEVHLSPKAFDLLTLLVEERHRAMPRAELHQRLWPSTFVLETNLASLIAEVRRALEDSADDPQYVRTMHRVGYWFIGHVRDDSPAPAAVAPATRYWLVWDTRQIALPFGEHIIGRAPDASIWLDAAGVSRHHARIIASDAPTVEDLGSKNGTFVRDEAVTSPRPLIDGDQIRIGSVVLTFRVPPPAGSTETVPFR